MPPAPRVDELKKRYEENPRRFFAPLANEYRKAGDLEAAIDLCKMHLEEQPGHLSGHIVYGQALFESSRPADARSIFEAALQLDPENLIALRHLGDIAKADGDATTATHWYQRVLDADPRNEEVTALIESLKQAPPPSTVVIAEKHAPPPSPNYAEESKPLFVEPSAPTPVISMAAVPPEPPTAPTPVPPRASIGLMDLDLNLADSTAPQVDFMSTVPPLPSEPPSVIDAPPPLEEELAPTFEAPIELVPSAAAPAPAGIETFGDISLSGETAQEPALDVLDTTFGAVPVEESPMFAAAAEPAAFGDGLDITAGAELDAASTDRMSLLDGIPVIDDGGTVAIGESITDPRPVSAHAAQLAPIVEPVTEPTPIAAPPTPATPGDFDALFGNAPISDVTIGGAAEPAVADAAGFIADSFVGREATDEMLDQAPNIATPPSPFVTETMAELYLQQGFRDEALNVYRQLLAQNPDDHGLAERVRNLEHGTRSSLAIDAVSEQIEEEARRSGGVPSVLEAAAAPVAGEPLAIERAPELAAPEPVAPLPDAVPAFLVEAPAPAAVVVPTPAPPPSGPMLRDLLGRIAARRAVAGGGFAPAPASEAAGAAPAPVAPSAAVATPAEVGVAAGGTIDALFGMTGVTALDEGAAVAMAGAFGGRVASSPIKGEPTRQGTDELSLSSVFKSDEPRPSAGVERQSRTLRFDQFFAPADDQSTAPSVPPRAPPGAGADDAQFSDWLRGLKGS